MKYSIYEGNMERLEKKLLRISNKCKKFGCPFTYKIIGEHMVETTTENDEKVLIKMIDIEVEGKAIVNNWQFVGSIEHTTKGNIITKAINIEVPERYYNSKPFCEHCQQKRNRKYTYIVRNIETGEFKQVGKSCLKDFTCGLDAELAATIMNGITELIKGETPYQGINITPYYNVVEFLTHCKETADIWGFKKAQETDSTCSVALKNSIIAEGKKPWWMTDSVFKEEKHELEKVGYNAEKHIEYVKNALKWIAEQEENNNFFHNLKVACSLEYIKAKNLALVCSLIPTYDRDIAFKAEQKRREEKRREEQRKSEHLGEIGKRITVDIDSVKILTSWANQWGYTWMYQFIDTKGNVIIWKSSKWIFNDNDELTKTKLTGTVKEHGEFRETKQTVLTRCKLS